MRLKFAAVIAFQQTLLNPRDQFAIDFGELNHRTFLMMTGEHRRLSGDFLFLRHLENRRHAHDPVSRFWLASDEFDSHCGKAVF
jgi:hypothetical protein